MTRRLAIGLALCAAPLLASCSFNDRANHARGCDNCAPGQCVLGYCLEHLVEVGTGGSGISVGSAGSSGMSSGPVAGSAPSSGGSGGSTMTSTAGTQGEPQKPTGPCNAGDTCYLGPAGTSGVGSCRSGTAQCQGTMLQSCNGQVLPNDESCNNLDDDCDGKVDEDVTLGSCSAAGMGACGAGQLRCEAGQQSCVASGEPMPEVCNGIDDDCDGVVDNGTAAVPCYPAGGTGCTKNADGSFSCKGVCKAGTQACVNGMLQACTGYVLPSMEICGGTQAADENCNGQIDDGCACTGSQTQPCYPGPLLELIAPSTACRVGTQHCMTDGTFGACEGAVTPVPETCQNQGSNDDCNLFVDDIPNLNAGCTVSANRGVCRTGTYQCRSGALTCVTPAALPEETACDGLDEDCDGKTDENYNLATDIANCGSCGHACASGELCCGGTCYNPTSDATHCGSCDHACGDGNACCGGTCVTTGTNAHCAGCTPCNQGEACCGGSCVTTGTTDHCAGCAGCNTGDACCDGACVTPDTTDHCGSCGGCNMGDVCCSGACVTPNTTDHCGGCGGCKTGEACCGGMCVTTGTTDHCAGCTGCNMGEACCSGACVPTDTTDHCGGCGPCNQGEACCGGSCTPLGSDAHCTSCDACPQSQTCCGSGCANLQTDANHCGQCNMVCSSTTGATCTCVTGMCQDSQGAACQ